MSRPSTGRPEFRLRFSYPTITIERDGVPDRLIPVDSGDPIAALRTVASEIALRRGRLTAILPEAEVWSSRTLKPDAASCRMRASVALAVQPSALALALGPVGPDGARTAIATRRSTLGEARTYLGRAGLRPDRIVGSGDRGERPGAPAFRRTVSPPPALLAATGLAARLALTVWLGPWTTPTPPMQTAVAPAASTPAPAVVAPAPALAPVLQAPDTPPRTAIAQVDPRARPATVRRPTIATSPPAPGVLTLAARNVPGNVAPQPEGPRQPAGLRVAALSGPLARPGTRAEAAPPVSSVALVRAPQARPASLAIAPAATTIGAASAAAAPVRPSGGPQPRPAGLVSQASVGTLVETLTAAIAAPANAAVAPEPTAAPAGAGVQPKARPDAPVRLAALGPTPAELAAVAASVALAIAPPQPRSPDIATVRPAKPAPAPPRPVATRPAQVARPAPVPPPAPKPQVVRAVAVQPAAPAPAPAQKPRAVAAQPTQPALGRNSVALIGVFGSAEGRHALLQLPSGQTQRVKKGDQFRGIQVTAIDADAVHMRQQGRDVVVRLPD